MYWMRANADVNMIGLPNNPVQRLINSTWQVSWLATALTNEILEVSIGKRLRLHLPGFSQWYFGAFVTYSCGGSRSVSLRSRLILNGTVLLGGNSNLS